jgi:hypothetical protein
MMIILAAASCQIKELEMTEAEALSHAPEWALSLEEQPPERPRHTIQNPKKMVTIAWNPLGFHILGTLSKGNRFNVEDYRVHIHTELLPLHPHIDERRLVIHADNARPHVARKCRAFEKKIGSASPYTYRTHLISHHLASFSSDISNIVCRELLFHHVKNYLQQFMKSSGPSRDQPWRMCFGTGWRDSNGFLRTTVTTIHKLNSGWFNFLGFLSESEMLDFGGTPYHLHLRLYPTPGFLCGCICEPGRKTATVRDSAANGATLITASKVHSSR